MTFIGADVALPGLALPEAFQSLDSRLESVLQLCTAKGSPEAQLVGMVTVCEEMKQLLKCTFIGMSAYLRWIKPLARRGREEGGVGREEESEEQGREYAWGDKHF